MIADLTAKAVFDDPIVTEVIPMLPDYVQHQVELGLRLANLWSLSHLHRCSVPGLLCRRYDLAHVASATKWNRLARSIAPFIPFSRGVRSNVAPYAAISLRRSIDIDSGITSTSL